MFVGVLSFSRGLLCGQWENKGAGRGRPFQRGHGLTRRPAHTSLRQPLFRVTREAGISFLHLHDEVKVPECKPVGPEGSAPVAQPGLKQDFLK